jgi:hypothetical protein
VLAADADPRVAVSQVRYHFACMSAPLKRGSVGRHVRQPDYGFGSILILVGIALIVGSRAAAAVTDPINERLTGRVHRGRRGYVLVGIGVLIVGVAALAGW